MPKKAKKTILVEPALRSRRSSVESVSTHIASRSPSPNISPAKSHVEQDGQDLKHQIQDKPIQTMAYLCDGLSALDNDMKNLQLLVEREQRKLEAVEFKVAEVDIIFGTQMVWCIDNLKFYYNEAKTGKRPVIFSRPFYTGKQGYKMAASCALYGDGAGKGKNMSVFLSIIQGEYDALLPWPFSCPIKVTLMDLRPDEEDRENLVHTITPNTCRDNLTFLGRPIGERNPSFGIQNFLALKDLEYGEADFVRDDALFIKIDVQAEDVPLL